MIDVEIKRLPKGRTIYKKQNFFKKIFLSFLKTVDLEPGNDHSEDFLLYLCFCLGLFCLMLAMPGFFK